LRPCSRTSFHHQPEAQHPKSSAIHKLPADYPIFRGKSGHAPDITAMTGFDPTETLAASDFRTAKSIVRPSLKRDIVPSVAWT
jgi:hypothetical protein